MVLRILENDPKWGHPKQPEVNDHLNATNRFIPLEVSAAPRWFRGTWPRGRC